MMTSEEEAEAGEGWGQGKPEEGQEEHKNK